MTPMADSQGPRSGSSAPRPSQGGFASSLGAQTLRGAALVLVAVAIGVILLNVVDDGTVSSTTKTTAASDKPDKPAKTTSTTAAQAKPAGEVKLVVLNGGGPVGAAGSMSEKLRAAGYSNQGQPADASNRGRTGNYAFCAQGLQAELAALAQALTEAAPDAPVVDTVGLPTDEAVSSQGYDCVVVVGG